MMKIEFLPKQNNLIYRQTVEVKYGIQAAQKAMNFLIFQIKLSAIASNLVSQKKTEGRSSKQQDIPTQTS